MAILVLSNERAAASEVRARQPFDSGYLSAYHKWPTLGTVSIREEWGQIPTDSLEQYDVLIAVNNCDMIGREMVMHVSDMSFDALVFDCAGPYGSRWMTENDIVAEIDYFTWMEYPWLVGTLEYATLELVLDN